MFNLYYKTTLWFFLTQFESYFQFVFTYKFSVFILILESDVIIFEFHIKRTAFCIIILFHIWRFIIQFILYYRKIVNFFHYHRWHTSKKPEILLHIMIGTINPTKRKSQANSPLVGSANTKTQPTCAPYIQVHPRGDARMHLGIMHSGASSGCRRPFDPAALLCNLLLEYVHVYAFFPLWTVRLFIITPSSSRGLLFVLLLLTGSSEIDNLFVWKLCMKNSAMLD